MTLETMLTKVSNYSSHIGDVVINEGAPPPTEEEDDVNNNDDRIAILEAEIASRKAEISRLKGGIDVNNDTILGYQMMRHNHVSNMNHEVK